MSARIAVLAALALVGAVAASSLAATPPAAPAPPPGGRGAAGGAPASLGSAMTEMNRMITAIQKESTDPAQLEQTLKDIFIMQRDIAISKLFTPPDIEKITSADEKAKALAQFRTMCNNLTKALLELEDAVNAKKPEDIKKMIAKIVEIGNEGHKQSNVDVKIGQ